MEGIIYKVQPYQEHARLLYTYTHEGKVTLLAQGAQKLNQVSRVLAQFLTKISFKESKKSFIQLQEGKILDDYERIKSDFYLTKAAALMLEIIDHLVVDNAKHALIFHELDLALQAQDIVLSSLSFSIKMIHELGYGLDLTPDGRPVKGVSIQRGQLVYQDEQEGVDLDTKDAVVLLKLSRLPYSELDLSDVPINRIKTFLLKYYQYHLQTTLKNLQ